MKIEGGMGIEDSWSVESGVVGAWYGASDKGLGLDTSGYINGVVFVGEGDM